jgi:hypothetical protein
MADLLLAALPKRICGALLIPAEYDGSSAPPGVEPFGRSPLEVF